MNCKDIPPIDLDLNNKSSDALKNDLRYSIKLLLQKKTITIERAKFFRKLITWELIECLEYEFTHNSGYYSFSITLKSNPELYNAKKLLFINRHIHNRDRVKNISFINFFFLFKTKKISEIVLLGNQLSLLKELKVFNPTIARKYEADFGIQLTK